MKKRILFGTIIAIAIGALVYSQSSNNDTVTSESTVVEQNNAVAVESSGGDRESAILNAKWGENVEISIADGTVSFSSDGLPNHEVLDQYLADGRDGKYVSEAPVTGYDASFMFPVQPTMLSTPVDAPNGAIGVAVSGAVFFNPFEGDGSATVANDDNSIIDGITFIDACGGHPIPTGSIYHYHGIPFCITDEQDTVGEHSEIIGFLFDGIPIYGPQDTDGDEPTNLDQCMGHTGPAPGYIGDVYHYHVSSSANYISECFSGEATTPLRS
jgi:hypothetical protein